MALHVEPSKDYHNLLQQIESVTHGEPDLIANLSNISALLKTSLQHHWIGFYFVKNNELVLGPFQGPLACTRIAYNKGVCGKAWAEAKTMVVPNVHEFPGHIACSSLSNSEMVVPIFKDNKVHMVLDIDSESFDAFHETDRLGLEEIGRFISTIL